MDEGGELLIDGIRPLGRSCDLDGEEVLDCLGPISLLDAGLASDKFGVQYLDFLNPVTD
jgi:hypothetical protein